jgi:hypothetical protein
MSNDTGGSMMAHIDQIQIKFVAVEDRLLLRVSSSDDLEFRFWMTRRFVKLIWPALGKALKATPRIQTQSSPAAKRELLAFEHQKAVIDSDFKTPYKETPKTLPLGNSPVLLAKMQMRRNDDGSTVMSLGPEEGAGIDLALDTGLLHSLAELISNGARVAEWDLVSPIEDNSTTAAPADATVN